MAASADKTAALIAMLWQKNKPIVEERIALLKNLPSTPPPQQLEDAISAAHKLSGALGMYGYPQASEIASKIEHTLKHDATATIAPLVEQLRQSLSTDN